MVTDRAVVPVLASTTEALVTDIDVMEILDDLASQTVKLLDIAAAGVMFVDRSERLRLVAASDEHTDWIALLHLLIYQQGPCVQCLRTGQITSAPALEDHRPQWPSFITAATALGVHTVHALPLRLHAHTLGVLVLLRSPPTPLPDDDLTLAQGIADLAVISLCQQHALDQHGWASAQLAATLNSRVTIEQAKGILAGYGDIAIEQAFNLLYSYAHAHHLRLEDLARHVVTEPDQAQHILQPGRIAHEQSRTTEVGRASPG